MAVPDVDVDLVEKVLFHEAVIRLQGVIVDRVIFIQVESDYILKAKAFVPVQPYELGVQGFG